MYYLIKISGSDKPGITSSVMEVLDNHHQTMVDMGQNVTHGLLSLSFLVKNDKNSSEIIKELLVISNQKQFQVEFDFLNQKKSNSKKGKKLFKISITHE